MADTTLHHTLPNILGRLKALWQAHLLATEQRRAERELQAAVDRLAALSPHYLDDIGLGALNASKADLAPKVPVGRA